MTRYAKLKARMAAGEKIMIDGGTGTELERRGATMVDDAWNSGGALTAPDLVREIHVDYIESGAEVIITNTFSTSRFVLADGGMADQFEFLNRRGVELAIEARKQSGRDDVLVAGGMTGVSFTRSWPSDEQVREDLNRQADILVEAGVDFLILEMMVNLRYTAIALDAVRRTGLPVWVGYSTLPGDDGQVILRHGQLLADGLALLQDRPIDLVSIMHTQVEFVDRSLDVLDQHWDGPTGVYAHSGKFVAPNWVFDGTISPVDYAEAAAGWLKRGVQVIGGCCGIRAEHMCEVRRRMSE
ncbi:MAG: homocysteine S-methyltransferase family protein [Chloroflexota bacterium]